MLLHSRRHQFDRERRVAVMGVLNVRLDSFSDGGRYDDPVRAVERALQMFEEGADVVGMGGESTGPAAPRTVRRTGAGGSGSVAEEEEERAEARR